jgi:hypothetical protein
MKAFRAPTLTRLHDGLCKNIVNAGPDQLDVITSVDVQIHGTVSEAESMEWEFDLKDLWLTPSRWSMMVRQYIDPDEFRAWLEQCSGKIGIKGRGIAVMRTKTVAARGGPAQGNKESRRWGSCMLAISYKAKPAPTITLYSRTSYLGYLSALDLSVAWMCARYLARQMGVDVESFRFVWFNEALQYHNFKSLAYLLNHPNKRLRKFYRRLLMLSDKKLTEGELQYIEECPALKLSRKWLQKLIQEDKDRVTLGDMSYNTYRRIRRRFHTEVRGYEYAQKFEGWSYYKKGPKTGEKKEFFKAYKPLPNTPVSGLDFRAIGMPLDGVTTVDYDGDDADEGEEDDD